MKEGRKGGGEGKKKGMKGKNGLRKGKEKGAKHPILV